MSYAYTPGLKIKKATIVEKERFLPVPGEILVEEGATVSYDTVVARTFVPGDINMDPVFYNVGVEPYQLPRAMLKKEGETVQKGEVLAKSSSLFGLIKTEYKSKYSGTIELISDVTGMVGIRDYPQPINVDAYISGRIAKVVPEQGVIVETIATFIQGIFGVGGERHGKLRTITSPNEVISEQAINDDCKNKILVGGSLITSAALRKAEQVGAIGIITGGIDRDELTSYLGYEMGVAITGNEEIGLTCIITEGFGEMTMATQTYNLLNAVEDKLASINGATQIRAGVIRPEIIIPLDDTDISVFKEEETLADGMYTGTRVRIIRAPYFGDIGTVKYLPVDLQQLESESSVRVMVVQLDDGREVRIPRANAEIMEE